MKDVATTSIREVRKRLLADHYTERMADMVSDNMALESAAAAEAR